MGSNWCKIEFRPKKDTLAFFWHSLHLARPQCIFIIPMGMFIFSHSWFTLFFSFASMNFRLKFAFPGCCCSTIANADNTHLQQQQQQQQQRTSQMTQRMRKWARERSEKGKITFGWWPRQTDRYSLSGRDWLHYKMQIEWSIRMWMKWLCDEHFSKYITNKLVCTAQEFHIHIKMPTVVAMMVVSLATISIFE